MGAQNQYHFKIILLVIFFESKNGKWDQKWVEVKQQETGAHRVSVRD